MNAIQKAAFLTLLSDMPVIDCMQSAILFNKTFDTSIDHHDFAQYLDELESKGTLRIAKYGYCKQYALNTEA